ncbi:MAG: MGMT family protein [Leptospiraceae bacterium]|nr:MGMT family protein [Leptospiraceae bacterium]
MSADRQSLNNANDLRNRIVQCIKSIPAGRVASYGQIAKMAGHPRAARQVARVLRQSGRSENLPWHRIINSSGRISLPGRGQVDSPYARQKSLLIKEGIKFDATDRVDFKQFGVRRIRRADMSSKASRKR